MSKRVDGRLGHRGQQLGEYAVMMGTVAMAVIAMQMTISRRVAGKLSLYSRVMLGEGAPIEDTQSEPTVSTSTVKEIGGATGVKTTLTSASSGVSSAGFILAEAYGPIIGEALRLEADPSELQVLLALDQVKPTDEIVELTKDEKGRVEATVLRDGQQITVGFTVLNVTEDEGGNLLAHIDTDGNGIADDVFAGILKSVVDKGALVESVLAPRLELAEALLELQQQFVDIAEKRGVEVDDVLKEAFGEDSQTIKAGWKAATSIKKELEKKLEEAGKSLEESLWDLKIEDLKELKTQTDGAIGPLKLAGQAIGGLIERGRHEPRLSGDVNEQDLLSSKIGFSQPPAAGPVAPDRQGEVTEGVTVDDVFRLTGNNAKSKNPIRMDGERLDTVVTGGVDDTLPDLIRTGNGTYEQVVWVPVKVARADQRMTPGEPGGIELAPVVRLADADANYMKDLDRRSAHSVKEQNATEDAALEVINQEIPDKKVQEAALAIIVSYRQNAAGPTLKEFVETFEARSTNGGYEAYFSYKKDAKRNEQLKQVLERVADPKSGKDRELAQAMKDRGYLGELDEFSVRGGNPIRVSDNKLLTESVYTLDGKPLLVKDIYGSFESLRLADGVDGKIVYHKEYRNIPIGIDECNDGTMDLVFGVVSGPGEIPEVVGRTFEGVTTWQPLTQDSTYKELVYSDYSDPFSQDTEREEMTPLVAVKTQGGESKPDGWIVRRNEEVKNKEGGSSYRTAYYLVRDSNNNDFLDQEDFTSQPPLEIQPPETRVARDQPANQHALVDTTGGLPAIVTTQRDDRVTFSEMRAVGEHPNTFGRTDVWIRYNPRAVDPDERPAFGPQFGEEKDPRFKDDKATGPPSRGQPTTRTPPVQLPSLSPRRQPPLEIKPYVVPKLPGKWEPQ